MFTNLILMNAYIPTKEDLKEFIRDAVKQTVNESLPGAIHKATRKKYLTTDDVMEILQCSRRHIQHLRDSGSLPFRQTGRTIRYDIDEVEAFLNRGKVNSKEVQK